MGEDIDPETGGEEIPSAADPAAYETAIKRSRVKEDNRVAFWRRTLQEPSGRWVIWDMLSDLGTFEERFGSSPAGFPDKEAREFYAGQKSFGLRLYRTLMVIDPLAIVQMHRDNDPAFQKPKPVRQTKED